MGFFEPCDACYPPAFIVKMAFLLALKLEPWRIEILDSNYKYPVPKSCIAYNFYIFTIVYFRFQQHKRAKGHYLNLRESSTTCNGTLKTKKDLSLRETRPLMTLNFGKRAIKVL